MADRRRQVILLLQSLYDGLPHPHGALRTTGGFVPSHNEPCSSCGGLLVRDDFGKIIRRRKGTGTVTDRFNRPTRCSACGGRGQVARDPMDALHQPVGSTATTATARPRQRVICDRCNGQGVWKQERCVLCDGEGKRDQHLFELQLTEESEPADLQERWNAAIDKRDESGSYRELERALAGIRVHVNKRAPFTALTAQATTALRLLASVYVTGARRAETLTTAESEVLELALAYLVWRMPTPIRVPAGVTANALERKRWRQRAKGRGTSAAAFQARDREIRSQVKRGVPVQRVAFEYELSVSQVNRVVSGDEEVA